MPPEAGSPFQGIGGWIWYLFRHFGSVENAIAKCQEFGISWVALKSNDDGTTEGFREEQCRVEIIDQFHAAGIRVYLWGYAWGDTDPYVAAAAAMLERSGADGHIVDFEQQGEDSGTALGLADALRTRFPDLPLAVAPQAVIHLHEGMDLGAWMARDYVIMPQWYWDALGGNHPGSFGFLQDLGQEWHDRADGARVFPVMSGSGGSLVQPADWAEFLQIAGSSWSIWRLDLADAGVYAAAKEGL